MAQIKTSGLLIFGIGLLMLLAVYSGSFNRAAQPIFDGDFNNFKISILNAPATAIEGNDYSVDLSIKNVGSEDGSMFVQCSILDRTQNTWIPALASVSVLDVNENCATDEPNTQTAKVTLEAGETNTQKYTFTVPSTSAGDNVVFCATLERCHSAMPGDEPTGQSDMKIQAVTVNKAIPGTVVNTTKAPTDLSNNALKAWIIGHSLLVTIAGILFVLVGLSMAYKMPKF